MHDLFRGFRYLWAQPSITAIIGFCVSLGVGSTAVVFAFLYHVVLEPLPYEDADGLVKVWQNQLGTRLPVSPRDFVDIENQAAAFEHLAAYAPQTFGLVGADEPSFVTGCWVSPGFFKTLRVRTTEGRVFSAGDGNVVLVSDRFRKNRFQSPAVIGNKILLDEKPFTIIGILPDDFSYPEGIDLWLPLIFTETELLHREDYYLEAIGRLRDGVSLAQARQELNVIANRLALQYPDTNPDTRLQLVSLKKDLAGSARISFYVLFGPSFLVSIMCCANVSGFLLARIAAGSHDIELRSALGANSAQLARHIVLQNCPLIILGGLGGLLIAQWGFKVARAWSPGTIPRFHQVSLSTVLPAALVLTLVAILLCSALPALQARRLIRRPVGRIAVGVASHGLRRIVLIEVALALILSVGATLLAKSYVLLNSTDLGFDPGNLLVAQVRLPTSRYSAEPAGKLFLREALEKINTLPSVRAVGAARRLPLGAMATTPVRLESSLLPSEQGLQALRSDIAGNYFSALGVRVIAGKTLSPGDDQSAQVLLNQTMAERFWPGQRAIGKRIHFGASDSPWHEIVGIVADVRQGTLRQDARPEFYAPLRVGTFLFFIIRADKNPHFLAPYLKRALWEIDGNLPVSIELMEDRLARHIAGPRFYSLVFGVYATIALAMAVSGVYGIVSYSVAQNHRAYGIRRALGATQRDLYKAVLFDAYRPVLVGIASGSAVALLTSGFLISLLHRVDARDPLVFVQVILGMTLACFVAIFGPAYRVSQVEPARALKEL